MQSVCVCLCVMDSLSRQTWQVDEWKSHHQLAMCVCVCLSVCVSVCVCLCVVDSLSRQTWQVDEWKSHHELAVKFLELGVASHHKRRHSLILSLHTNYVHLRHEHTYAR